MEIHIVGWLTVVAVLWTAQAQKMTRKSSRSNNDKASCSATCQEIEILKKAVVDLSKQVLMQQNMLEEWTRTNSYSGVQVIRGTKRGPRNYDYTSHLSPSAFTMHDHSNYDRTIGYGEVSVVMNGVNFRTRHNDYKLLMPSTKSKNYHAYEEIPFPEVPPEVLRKATVQEQITELRQWFKAFKDQDPSVRDYTKYFKPVLCYMEGAWTVDKHMEEPFPSDRHWLDAKSWDDLHERFRFTAFTGTKSRLENNAFLPTCIIRHNKSTGLPEYAQWNYRILCHPINKDIPLSYFQQEDDLTFRVATGQTLEETVHGRAARFKLVDPQRKKSNYQLLDEIFAQIPGKDNYGANMTFTVFGETMYDTEVVDKNSVVLNTGYYHRSYKSIKNGAGGIAYTAFGFNDENFWMAETTQERVAAYQTDRCFIIVNEFGKNATRCREGEMRISYALPLEIIYMTPLLRWNPYNLVFHQDITTANKDGRNGGPKSYQAFDGTDKINYYRTPNEFFTGNTDKTDPADTVRNYVYVNDRKGIPRKVSASGTRITLQPIDEVGKIRLRYAITPLSGEGSSVWKELNALKDKVQNQGPELPSTVQFEMSTTVMNPPGEHTHQFSISFEEYNNLLAGEEVNVTTEAAQEHTHDLTIAYFSKDKKFRYTRCDGEFYCSDGHAPLVIREAKSEDF